MVFLISYCKSVICFCLAAFSTSCAIDHLCRLGAKSHCPLLSSAFLTSHTGITCTALEARGPQADAEGSRGKEEGRAELLEVGHLWGWVVVPRP